MKALLVCVDYWDYLAVTLPLNKHHFDRMLIVTSPADHRTQQLCIENQVDCYPTNAFYENGAHFNKWKALEEGLDVLGREGWLCLMDADIVWPQVVTFTKVGLQPGKIYTPFRRMLHNVTLPLPPEEEWADLPRHKLINEFSGYTQIFHADDPVLGEPPWHETNWEHAGGADTFFSRQWSKHNWVRPPFEVLHLGQNGWNWYGRASNYLDGTTPKDSEKKVHQLRQAMKLRRKFKNFEHEKID